MYEEIERFNQQLADWKASQNPVRVWFVKKECDTVLLRDAEGTVHRVNKNRIWARGPLEEAEVIEARQADLNGDYLKG